MYDQRRIDYFMDIAKRSAELSYARKLKVGAVAVYEGRPICTGYNGTPKGEDNRCEDVVPIMDGWQISERLVTRPDVEHAERNLIYFAASEGIRLKGATLFTTHSPCIECARAIYAAGFVRVYCCYPFNDLEGLNWLAERIPCHLSGASGLYQEVRPSGSRAEAPLRVGGDSPGADGEGHAVLHSG